MVAATRSEGCARDREKIAAQAEHAAMRTLAPVRVRSGNDPTRARFFIGGK